MISSMFEIRGVVGVHPGTPCLCLHVYWGTSAGGVVVGILVLVTDRLEGSK